MFSEHFPWLGNNCSVSKIGACIISAIFPAKSMLIGLIFQEAFWWQSFNFSARSLLNDQIWYLSQNENRVKLSPTCRNVNTVLPAAIIL